MLTVIGFIEQENWEYARESEENIVSYRFSSSMIKTISFEDAYSLYGYPPKCFEGLSDILKNAVYDPFAHFRKEA